MISHPSPTVETTPSVSTFETISEPISAARPTSESCVSTNHDLALYSSATLRMAIIAAMLSAATKSQRAPIRPPPAHTARKIVIARMMTFDTRPEPARSNAVSVIAAYSNHRSRRPSRPCTARMVSSAMPNSENIVTKWSRPRSTSGTGTSWRAVSTNKPPQTSIVPQMRNVPESVGRNARNGVFSRSGAPP